MFVNDEEGCINVRICVHGPEDFGAGSALLELFNEIARGPRRQSDVTLVRTGDVLSLDYYCEVEVAPGYVAHPHLYAVAPGLDDLHTRVALRKGDGLLLLTRPNAPHDLEQEMRDFLFMDPSAPVVHVPPAAPLLPSIEALLAALPLGDTVAASRRTES